MASKSKKSVRVARTVGHGARSLAELVELLVAHGVDLVVDVRKMPRSAANPQFNFETLPGELAKAGIGYRHEAGLTGLRKRRKASINTAWRNKSFQAYADYMQTPEFEASVEALVELAGERALALMCAETVPWRCHRSLIADALVARGVAVVDLLSATKSQVHFLPDFARVEGNRVYYPGV